MTKEMRPAHRVDVLTHALLYYGLRVKYKLRKKISFCLKQFNNNMYILFHLHM